MQVQLHEYVDFFGYYFAGAAIALIVIGALVLIIGFFGCCGAYKEQKCMIRTVSQSNLHPSLQHHNYCNEIYSTDSLHSLVLI